MSYEIPQEIAYQEKIVFGLNWKQIMIALLTLLPSFFVIIRNVYAVKNYVIALPLAFVGVSFVYFDAENKLLAFYRFKKFRKAETTSALMKQYLNIKNITNNTLILKKGFPHKISIIEITPTNLSLKSDVEKESLSYSFQKFLNSIDFPLQFLITTDKQEQKYHRNFYIIIPETKNLELQTKFLINKTYDTGLKAKRLNDSGIIKVFNEFFKQNNETVSYAELKKDYMHCLLSPNCIENKKDHLIIDDTYCRIISAIGYPRSVEFGFLNKIIKLQKDIDISIHVEPFSIEKLMIRLNRELQKQRADLYSTQQKGSTNPALEIKHSDTRKVLEDLQKGEEKLFLVSLYINCKTTNFEELEEITQTVTGELNSLLIIPETPIYLQAQAFKSCLPLCQNLLAHKRNITTKPLSAFFPFTTKFHTTDTTGIIFGMNENKLPITKDIFQLPNHNGVILASSGGGKSYLAKLLIQRYHQKNTKIFIIDPEGEYTVITEKLGGQVITIGIGGQNSINPLDFMGHTYETKKLSLHEIFYLMFNNLGDLQRSALDDATTKAYTEFFKKEHQKKQEKEKKDNDEKKEEKDENKEYPTLQDIYNIIKSKECESKNPPDKSMYAALSYRLSIYTQGAFSFLNKKTNIELNNNLVCFHLKDLPTVIQPVLMYLIMDFIYTSMKNSQEQKLLFVDEAWSLLNKTEENSFLFKIIKTCRKHTMGVFLITQETEDLLSNKTGKAILANSATTILLRQKPNVIKQLTETFNLNKEETSILINANIGKSIMIFNNEREQATKQSKKNSDHNICFLNVVKQFKNLFSAEKIRNFSHHLIPPHELFYELIPSCAMLHQVLCQILYSFPNE